MNPLETANVADELIRYSMTAWTIHFLMQIYSAADITALKVLHRAVCPSEAARAKRASSHHFGMWMSIAVKLECPVNGVPISTSG